MHRRVLVAVGAGAPHRHAAPHWASIPARSAVRPVSFPQTDVRWAGAPAPALPGGRPSALQGSPTLAHGSTHSARAGGR